MSLFPESSVLKAKMQYLEIKECITLNNRNIILEIVCKVVDIYTLEEKKKSIRIS